MAYQPTIPEAGSQARQDACRDAFEASPAGREAMSLVRRVTGREPRLVPRAGGGNCTVMVYDEAAQLGYRVDAHELDDGMPSGFRASGKGCGEGFLRRAIPDFEFGRSCDAHDACYIFRTSADTDEMVGRAGCDDRMLADAAARCSRSSGRTYRLACHAGARSYWALVRTFGWIPWRQTKPANA